MSQIAPAPMLAGNISREVWEAAYSEVWKLRLQYPPDSLSAIYQDIAIRIQAERDALRLQVERLRAEWPAVWRLITQSPEAQKKL